MKPLDTNDVKFFCIGASLFLIASVLPLAMGAQASAGQHPKMIKARGELTQADGILKSALQQVKAGNADAVAGHRAAALKDIESAIAEINAGVK